MSDDIKPLVSVIIPAYNHEKYIHYCLDSIIAQTYDNIELIILNDGSSDNTNAKILQYESKLKKRFKNYIYINKLNEGICKTLNLGLKLAKGDYIKTFASDDEMEITLIEKEVEYFNQNEKIGMIYTDGYQVKSEGDLIKNCDYSEKNLFSKNMKFLEGDLLSYFVGNIFAVPSPTTMITRRCYKVVGNYDENLKCEDPDMYLRIAMKFHIGSIKIPLVFHRIHSNNSGQRSDIIVPSMILMQEKYGKMDFNGKLKRTLLNLLEKVSGVKNTDNKVLISYKIGVLYYRGEKYLNAYKYFSTALEYNDSNEFSFEYYLHLVESFGYCMINLKKFEKYKIVEGYQKIYCNYSDYIFILGLLYMNIGKINKAIDCFEKCTSLVSIFDKNTRTCLPNYNLGVIYECLNMKDLAIEYYKKCGDYNKAIDRIKTLGYK